MLNIVYLAPKYAFSSLPSKNKLELSGLVNFFAVVTESSDLFLVNRNEKVLIM